MSWRFDNRHSYQKALTPQYWAARPCFPQIKRPASAYSVNRFISNGTRVRFPLDLS